MAEDAPRDDARRAQLLTRMNDMLELIECHIRDDETGWEQRIEALAQRQDGSLEEVVRILSQWGAYTTVALAQQTGASGIDDALHAARVLLTEWIEGQSPGDNGGET